MKKWPKVALGEILIRSNELASIDPEAIYQEVTIKVGGKGVISRGILSGAAIGAARQFVRAGQLILSKIDARNGAIGIVPEVLDGAIVSKDFPSFEIDEDRILPSYLGWVVRSESFVNICRVASEGTTNRVRIREDRFLQQEIELPPHDVQRSIISRLDAVAEKARQVAARLDAIEADGAAFIVSQHHALAGNRTLRLGEILELHEIPEVVNPDGSYPQVGVKGFGGGLFPKAAICGTETTYKTFNRLYMNALVLSQVKGWEGALAICPKELEGMYVSPEYRTFRCREISCSSAYISELVRIPWFWQQLQEATRGVGARRERTRPEQFLALEMPMPTLSDQIKGSAALSHLAAMKAKHAAIRKDLDALLPSMLERIFQSENC